MGAAWEQHGVCELAFTLPEMKRNIDSVLKQYVHDFERFTTDGRVLFCRYLEVKVSLSITFHILQQSNIKHTEIRPNLGTVPANSPYRFYYTLP
jgi:hypothetical protein